MLADNLWDEGITLGFELIAEKDLKVQRIREKDGLYLFYGVRHADGIEL